jgi:PAS domain S-box-containing protein
MPGINVLYLLPFIISTGISIAVGVYCWKNRGEPRAKIYALVAFSQASWTFGYILELLGTGIESKIFWDNFQFIGGAVWVTTFAAFTFEYAGWRIAHSKLIYGLISIPGIIIVVLSFSDPLHNLVRPVAELIHSKPFSALTYDFTLPVWIWSTYGCGMILACIIILTVEFIYSHPLYRTQVGLVLLGNLLPLVSIVMTLTGFIQGPYRDTSPITFAIGNLLVAWGLFRYRLFDIVPLAWNKVIESISDSIIILDARQRVVNLNQTARSLSGLDNKNIIGKQASEVFSAWSDLVEKYADVKEASTVIETNTVRGLTYFELRIQALYDHHARFKGRVLIARDITDQKKAENELIHYRDHLEDLVRERTKEFIAANQHREELEEKLRQSQKLEALGRLAGGIAHDFNNLLVPILGYVELSMLNLEPKNKLFSNLTQIRNAAERSAGLVEQILAFSRQQMLEIRVLDLNRVILDFQPMLERLIREDIEFKLELNPSPIPVKIDKVQIEQMLMNLIINARDAMPEGGKITVTTSGILLDAVETANLAPDLKPGSYVILTVSDSGNGMDNETQKRIFDPFFTTKKNSEGTGLGLATVFGIVKQHQGNIGVISVPSKGTTFTIHLPRANEQPKSESQANKNTLSVFGKETVLVVEDEEVVRNLVCETLNGHGYKTIEAKSPADCLKLVANNKPVHLLLTDVIMPGMNGKELLQKLIARQPDIRVLYMSGYTNDIIVHHGVLDEGITLLRKPFTVHSLLQKVREVLN